MLTKDLLMNEIIMIIHRISDAMEQRGNVLSELYSCFLSPDRDKDIIVSVVRLFAEYVNDEFDYILFTDNPKLTSNVWKIALIDDKEQLDNILMYINEMNPCYILII